MLNPDIEKLLSFIPEKEKEKLDINDPIQVKAFLNSQIKSLKPLNSEDYIEKLSKKQLKPDEDGGLTIEPEKSFVLKTRVKSTLEKLFINVTTHPLVDEPEETELPSQKDTENAHAGIRLPMSVGDLSDTTDKKSRPARVIDVIVNPSIAKKIRPNAHKVDNELLNLFGNILFEYINQKYKIVLLNEYIIMRGIDYKGSYVKYQRVKATKKAKIEVVENNIEENELKENVKSQMNLNPNLFESQNTRKVKMTPDWKLFFVFVDDEIEEVDGFNFSEDVIGVQIVMALNLLITGFFIS